MKILSIDRNNLYEQDYSKSTVIETSTENNISRNVLMDDTAKIIALMIKGN